MEGGAILRILIQPLLHTMCVVQPVVEAQKLTEEYTETEQQTRVLDQAIRPLSVSFLFLSQEENITVKLARLPGYWSRALEQVVMQSRRRNTEKRSSRQLGHWTGVQAQQTQVQPIVS